MNNAVAQSLRTAARDPGLAFFVRGGTLLIAVYGQWSATLAPYLTGSVPEGMEIYAYLVSVNGVTVRIGNPFVRRFIEHTGALNGLVIGCILLAVGEIAFLRDAKPIPADARNGHDRSQGSPIVPSKLKPQVLSASQPGFPCDVISRCRACVEQNVGLFKLLSEYPLEGR